ncbi:helix-turn-helix domain-containing protein [Allorhodopirellula heiligendammensis]|uniref:DNA-binding transcriptional regulator AraC n=1 Tax=Allorhodopirellula heiligendammensis TaxID=2714739 RepID=A0A5C6BYI8_9BACT|nr:helix-turn-helix domain-containing protein [Allorhodopirellula heiligendammensis]TWU15679.1 DNA-binding transcriptional regulator AraC [Allorhodopirellula heiligendammensis]
MHIELFNARVLAPLVRFLESSGADSESILDRARIPGELLAETPLAISEIAQQLGYSGTNNFVRGFRRLSGVTPGAYRRQEQSPAA